MINSLRLEIKGNKIINISRACDLVCIDFGTPKGEVISLHIQCFFRLIKDGKILVSSDDIYRCPTSIDSESFAWDIPGQSIFDLNLSLYWDIITNSPVCSVHFKKIGDLEIKFEQNMMLQIIVDTSITEEKYRIFNSTKEMIIES